MIHARDIMTTDVVTVTTSTPIEEAIDLLVEMRVSGLPVVDDEGRLVGVVTEKDALPILYETSSAARSITVGSRMTAKVVTHQAGDSIKRVCDTLIANSFRRVPILEDGQLVGLVSRHDILAHIVRLRRRLEGE